jgi:hypothetical protein
MRVLAAAMALYAISGYAAFWVSLDRAPGETVPLVVFRAGLYLICGPLIFAAGFAVAEWAAYREREFHRAAFLAETRTPDA